MSSPSRSSLEPGDLDRVYRAEHGRVEATLTRRFGDIEVAEEAAQEAYLIALQRWPETGLPPNPGGWLTTTAYNRAVDRIWRESTRDARQAQAQAAMMIEPSDDEFDTGHQCGAHRRGQGVRHRLGPDRRAVRPTPIELSSNPAEIAFLTTRLGELTAG